MDPDAVGACFAAAKSSWSLETKGEMKFGGDEYGGTEDYFEVSFVFFGCGGGKTGVL